MRATQLLKRGDLLIVCAAGGAGLGSFASLLGASIGSAFGAATGIYMVLRQHQRETA